jgi:RNA recognition motif-containing protein
MSDQSTIYIGNMPYTANEDDLIGLVKPRLTERVTIPTEKETHRPRGFAFIEFTNDDDAISAVKLLDGFEFRGRILKVNIAKPQPGGGRRDRGGRRERR